MRRLVALLFSLAATGAIPVAAQGFKPTKPLELVTHTGPGGGGDVVARFISQAIDKEKLLPVRMQVINKPGGSGAVAAAYLVEKKGDTHTLAFFTGLWIGGPLTSREARVQFHEYWENLFERLSKTDTWRKYLEENQVEDGFQKGADLARSAEEFIAQRREIFKEAGIPMYR